MFSGVAEWAPNVSSYNIGDRIWFCPKEECKWIYPQPTLGMKPSCPWCESQLHVWIVQECDL